MSIPDSVLKNLKHQFLVVRKEAIAELVASLKTNPDALPVVENFVFDLLAEDTWQSKQSAFLLSQQLMDLSDAKFQSKVLQTAQAYFEFEEHRVREAVADCMGDLARVGGLSVYQTVKQQLLKLIEDNFERPGTDASGPQALAKLAASRAHKHDHEHEHNHNHTHLKPDAVNGTNGAESPAAAAAECKDDSTQPTEGSGPQAQEDANGSKTNPSEAASDDKKESNGAAGAAGAAGGKVIAKPTGQHDTEGWKCLWSAMKTIERMICGLDKRFEPEIDANLLALLQRATWHINRFVREVTYQTYAGICRALSKNGLQKLGKDLSIVIKAGLGDNWSQVRYAASHAVREFFETFDTMEEKSVYFETLLPAMCLNRYYVAAGVRVYSLESWKGLVGMQGRALVARYIDSVVKYFTMQACADNHAVREAACHCIAELALKVAEVDRDAVAKHVTELLDALIACFKDESWPVRDAACIACGDFVSKFPQDVCEKDLNDLYHLWFEHLSDNIPSVREDAAIALGKILKVFGSDAETRALNHINKNLLRVKDQKPDSKQYGELETDTVFGVAAKKKRDNDPNVHTGKQQYSCGSLAPKLKRATRSGCMDHGFSRDREPWEYTDGSVHLLKELIVASKDPKDSKHFETFVAPLSEVAGIRSFAHFHLLQQSIWDSIPAIAKAVGKRKFKAYLELLLNPMVETLECKNRLAENAAGKSIMFCNEFIGPRFFQARLKPDMITAIRKSQFVEIQM